MARLIWTGAGLVLVALLLAYNVLPTATGERTLRVSTPNPFPQAEGAPVALAPGARACPPPPGPGGPGPPCGARPPGAPGRCPSS